MLKRLGLEPGDVSVVAISHLHGDLGAESGAESGAELQLADDGTVIELY